MATNARGVYQDYSKNAAENRPVSIFFKQRLFQRAAVLCYRTKDRSSFSFFSGNIMETDFLERKAEIS